MKAAPNPDHALRLRPWAALLLFVSAYAPLLLILAIKDLDASGGFPLPRHPWLFGGLLGAAAVSSFAVLRAMRGIRGGLTVEVSAAANKSGEMFGYTIPYILSFVRLDLGDWQTLASLGVFLAMLFAIAYRTQTVFVNPILALAGYMLIDCTFKRGASQMQAVVITRIPLAIGQTYRFERLSHYLYATPETETRE